MTVDELGSQRILSIDDNPVNLRLLERMLLAAGFDNVLSMDDATKALELVPDYKPDLILLDLHMPEMDGFEFLSRVTPTFLDEFMPILVVTADATLETRRRALMVGATDFVAKPFDMLEVTQRVKNLLGGRMMYKRQADHQLELERKVSERTADLEAAHLDMVKRLAIAAEHRDDDTGEHTRRVAAMAAAISRQLGIDQEEAAIIFRAAPLHDVGKIGIPDSILLKPGRLTPEEFDVMKTHTTQGAEILRDGGSHVLRVAEEIAMTHHERWDGTGYPRGLAGEEIPLVGRIVAVADVFDALTSNRPYKKAWSVREAVGEVNRSAGTQFDPIVVNAFNHVTSNEMAASA